MLLHYPSLTEPNNATNNNANFAKLETTLTNNGETSGLRNLLFQPPNGLSKKINHVVRKSSKCRLENIYKPVGGGGENFDLLKTAKKSLDATNGMTPSSPPQKVASTKSAQLQQPQNSLIFQKSIQFADGRDSVVICTDPNCEFKTGVAKQTSSGGGAGATGKSKKEYPHERYQRIKKAEVQTVENIISDIPSTLHVGILFFLLSY